MHFIFWAKRSYQSPIFDTSKYSVENLPNSSCHFPNHKSLFFSNFAWFFSVLKNNSSFLFLGQMLYTFKEMDRSKCKFLRLECLDKNSPNSCYFWNNKSAFLQILHHSWVSRNITPLYFFSWNFIHFQQKEPIKVQFGKISREQSKVWNFAPWWTSFVQII